MATGSSDVLRYQTIRATSAHYRTLTAHLAKGLPALVGGDANVVRVRLGGGPHRKANGAGKEFIATVAPEQSNPPAGGIPLFETVCIAKQPDPGASIPAVARYMYLQRGQERRSYSKQARGRAQCDRPAPVISKASPSFIRRSPGATAASAPFAKWVGWLYRWATYLTMSVSMATVYGMPTEAGIDAGMVWSRRRFFSPMFSSRPYS